MDIYSALQEYLKLQNWQTWEKDLKKITQQLQQELYHRNEPSGKDE